jgi:hypothetical protein
MESVMSHRTLRHVALALLLAAWPRLAAQVLADGFSRIPEGARIVAMPLDVELYAITAGGVAEPKAEWTGKGRANLAAALAARAAEGHAALRVLTEAEAEPYAELRHLHAAVADAILIHHLGSWRLPGKGGRMDWSLGGDTAALVELGTGRVLWFNRLARAAGDVREPKPARKTLDLLLAGFPG